MARDSTPCPFCLENRLLRGELLHEDELWYFVSVEREVLRAGGMAISKRHVATPFELDLQEWVRLHELLPVYRGFLDQHEPQGYNIGWNVHPAGGQNEAHAHLHIFARFDDEPLAGIGIRHAFKVSTGEPDPTP